MGLKDVEKGEHQKAVTGEWVVRRCSLISNETFSVSQTPGNNSRLNTVKEWD